MVLNRVSKRISYSLTGTVRVPYSTVLVRTDNHSITNKCGCQNKYPWLCVDAKPAVSLSMALYELTTHDWLNIKHDYWQGNIPDDEICPTTECPSHQFTPLIKHLFERYELH